MWGASGISHRCAGGMWAKLDRGLSPPGSPVAGRGDSEREDGRKGGDGVKWIPKEPTAVK